MFLKCSTRHKDGKEHRSWSIVESRRSGRQVVQRPVLYLGEINDSQRLAWQRSIEVFDEQQGQSRQYALFPEDRTPPPSPTPAGHVCLARLRLARPRTCGACWLGGQLWRELHLDTFFAARLGHSREGTDWEKIVRRLTLYRLLSPGSEWRLPRHWFGTTALADLLGVDERAAQDDTLHRGRDGLLEHKDALFAHPTPRARRCKCRCFFLKPLQAAGRSVASISATACGWQRIECRQQSQLARSVGRAARHKSLA